MEIRRLEELNNRLISILNSLFLIIILQEWYVEKETNNDTDIDLVYRNYSQKSFLWLCHYAALPLLQ